MPFTISHTAVVLPFSRWLARWQLLSAATIGAMVPDFRVFFPGHAARVETHSLTALLTFCLPVGLITYWVFQLVIKSPILEVLPDGPYARWRPFAAEADIRSLRQWLLASMRRAGGSLDALDLGCLYARGRPRRAHVPGAGRFPHRYWQSTHPGPFT